MQKTEKSRARFDELTGLISRPEIIADNREWKKLVKERSSLEELANAHEQLSEFVRNLEGCEKDLAEENDVEMKTLFEAEIEVLNEKIEAKVEEIKILLLPKDENDDSNAIVEIRSAAGGDESALFCLELCRMYSHYAEKRHWKVEYIEMNETEIGGIKDATLMIKGKGAFARMKYESGVHRVQRVPETESQGRIHTSTSTVAVLPEVEEIDFEILDSDLRIDTYHSGGAGGQNVNKVETAIRITYMPLNIVVTCQDERSQLKNKEKAFNILKAKLYDYYEELRNSEYEANRKSQVGRGNRNERIRTYNYPQGRVTDHRTNLSSYDLTGVLNGNLDEFIDAMILKERTELLENYGQN
ncbi:MAG: peptide chain release factor 1 [Clostridia bacterium]|nr:peptide chain release factor 1 [Clostridia bacterium]